MREVRLVFSKTDRCKYISHLDINRCMSRALSRAEIPLWFTEGFNPHPYMSFSLPLSLGVESLCESVDLRIVGEITNDEINIASNALQDSNGTNAQIIYHKAYKNASVLFKNLINMLPTGIRIADVCDDFRDCSEIAYSDYIYKFEFKDNENLIILIKQGNS